MFRHEMVDQLPRVACRCRDDRPDRLTKAKTPAHGKARDVAATAGDARQLIHHFMAEHAGTFLRIDISGDSGLGDWLTTNGLPEVGHVTTMIRGQRPAVAGEGRTYSLASQSFG